MALLRKLSLFFAAGSFGGLIKSMVLWQAGELGIVRALGVRLAYAWKAAWLYPHLVWGGVWGLIFILPLFSASPVKKGLLLSLAPTLVHLFILPRGFHHSLTEIAAGNWTSAAVLTLNAVWGVAAGLWLHASGEK